MLYGLLNAQIWAIYAVEKMLKDNGDKISEDDKKKLEEAIEKAKKDVETDDIDKLRAAIDEFSKASNEVVTKLYQNANANANTGDANSDSNNNSDDVIIE